MKAVILCGGRGTRFPEETHNKPKCLIQIAGKTILEHILVHFIHYGYNEFIIAGGYKWKEISKYFINTLKSYRYDLDNYDYGEFNLIETNCLYNSRSCRILIADTGSPEVQKGSRIFRLEKFTEKDPFIVTYGDGVSNINLNLLQTNYEQNSDKFPYLISVVKYRSQYGVFKLDQQGRATAFIEKPVIGNYFINIGYSILGPNIFTYLDDSDNCDFERGFLDERVLDGKVNCFVHEGFWSCMDTAKERDNLEYYYKRYGEFYL